MTELKGLFGGDKECCPPLAAARRNPKRETFRLLAMLFAATGKGKLKVLNKITDEVAYLLPR